MMVQDKYCWEYPTILVADYQSKDLELLLMLIVNSYYYHQQVTVHPPSP
ncbi:MAG: hypothetical protein ACRC80_27755 [Waterburya sp.]